MNIKEVQSIARADWESLSQNQQLFLLGRWCDTGALLDYYYSKGYTDDAGVSAAEDADTDLIAELFYETFWWPRKWLYLKDK